MQRSPNEFEERYRREAEPWMFTDRAAELVRYEWIREQVRRLRPMRVLDVGCSLGQLAIRLGELRCELHAIDIAPTAVARARESMRRSPDAGRTAFVCGSATALPYSAESFDVIVASDGLYSWNIDRDDRRAAIHEISRVLRHDGTAILTEHMRPDRFDSFVGEIRDSSLKIASIDYLYDRPWYQFESWFKAIPSWPGIKTLRRNTAIARLLSRIGRAFGPRASRHICVLASRR